MLSHFIYCAVVAALRVAMQLLGTLDVLHILDLWLFTLAIKIQYSFLILKCGSCSHLLPLSKFSVQSVTLKGGLLHVYSVSALLLYCQSNVLSNSRKMSLSNRLGPLTLLLKCWIFKNVKYFVYCSYDLHAFIVMPEKVLY